MTYRSSTYPARFLECAKMPKYKGKHGGKRVKKSKMAVVKSKHRWLWRETSKIIFVHGKSDFWISVDGVVDDR